MLFHVAAGFFFYGVCLFSFVHESAKTTLMVAMGVPATIFLSLGVAVRSGRFWRRDVGAVLVSAAGFSGAVAFSFACMIATPEFRELYRPDAFHFFSDWPAGVAFTGLLGAAGGLLLRSGTNERDPPIP